jgi:uncharacterized protein YkwD
MLGMSMRAVAACLMLVCALSAPSTAGARTMSGAELQVMNRINGLRASYGLKPLRADGRLADAAKAHNADMLSKGFFAHESSNGADPFSRLRRYRSADVLGEVLAYAPVAADTSANGVVLMWKRSAPHLDTLTDRRFRRIGISRLRGRLFGIPVVVWTADLASRR